MRTLFSFRFPFKSALLLFWVWFGGAALASGPIVILDPGHGGSEAGAVRGPFVEKAMNLRLALLIERQLHALGVNTGMTRDQDITVPLASRASFPSLFQGQAVFVSIHHNASVNTGAQGIETCYANESSRRLAQLIQRSLVEHSGATDRGIKQRTGLHVLKHSTAPTAILIEAGFISNDVERSRLADTDYQEILAMTIAEGLYHYVRTQMPDRASGPFYYAAAAPQPRSPLPPRQARRPQFVSTRR